MNLTIRHIITQLLGVPRLDDPAFVVLNGTLCPIDEVRQGGWKGAVFTTIGDAPPTLWQMSDKELRARYRATEPKHTAWVSLPSSSHERHRSTSSPYPETSPSDKPSRPTENASDDPHALLAVQERHDH